MYKECPYHYRGGKRGKGRRPVQYYVAQCMMRLKRVTVTTNNILLEIKDLSSTERRADK